MVINTPSGRTARADGYQIRTATVAADKPLFTTIAQLGAAVASVEAIREPFTVRSLQNYALDRAERLARTQQSEQSEQSQQEQAPQLEKAPQLEQAQ
jgi:carbamoyl-phosphate synthase large subunit